MAIFVIQKLPSGFGSRCKSRKHRIMNSETVFSFYQALPPHLRAYWIIAITFSVIFLVQMVLTFIGLGDSDSGDMGSYGGGGDGDTMDTGGAMQLFTIRNVVNFMLGVGWGGVCLSSVMSSRWLLALSAVLCGCIMVAAFIIMFRQLMKLERRGSYRIQESLGQVCEVYLRIPAGRSGCGKVQVSFHGSVQELPAQTDGEAIPSGKRVRVVQVVDDKMLVVAPL